MFRADLDEAVAFERSPPSEKEVRDATEGSGTRAFHSVPRTLDAAGLASIKAEVDKLKVGSMPSACAYDGDQCLLETRYQNNMRTLVGLWLRASKGRRVPVNPAGRAQSSLESRLRG